MTGQIKIRTARIEAGITQKKAADAWELADGRIVTAKRIRRSLPCFLP